MIAIPYLASESQSADWIIRFLLLLAIVALLLVLLLPWLKAILRK